MSDILDNYIKLFLLIRGPATQALRALMTYYLRKCCLTFQEFIDRNQHEIYHLHNHRRCCQCSDQCVPRDTSKTPIQMAQMEIMFNTSSQISSKRKDNHDYSKKDMCCCYAKCQICVDDVDITLLRILLNNFCDIFFWTCYLNIEHSGKFEQFLKNKRHELFHLWQPRITCCKCNEHKNTYKRPKKSEINEQEFESLYTLDRTIKAIECSLNDTCTYSAKQGISQIDIRDSKLFQTITDRFCSPRKEINSIVETRNNCSHSTDIIEEDFKKCWSTLRDSINKIESITESKLWTEETIDRLEKKLDIENLLNEIKTDVEKIIGNEKDSQKILQKKMVQIYGALKQLIPKPTKNNPAQSFTSLSHKNYTEHSICLHPKQFKLKLLKLYKEMGCDTEDAEKRLKENCRNLNLTFRNETPRNGNCFFDAVSSQMRDLGLRERSAEEMRQNVIDYLMENREFQGVDGVVNIEHFIDDSTFEDWASNMKRNGVFADHVVVLGMARMLETDMLIVTSNPQANSENCMTYIVGKMDYNKSPILLGHVWENHYHSLMSLDACRENDRLADNNTEWCTMQSQNPIPSIIDSCITELNKIKLDSYPSNYEDLYRKASRVANDDESKGGTQTRISNGIALAELVGFIEESRSEDNLAPVFKMSDLSKMFGNKLEKTGAEQESRVHSTRLKNRLLTYLTNIEAYKQGRENLLAFKDDIEPALRRACEEDYDSNYMQIYKAVKIVRRLSVSYDRILSVSASLTNTLCKQYQEDGYVCPPSLQIGLVTTAAVDNIDHNPSSTTAQDSFHGTGISLFQHVTSQMNGQQRIDFRLTDIQGGRVTESLPDSYAIVKPAVLKTNVPVIFL
ncbi:unnamed protein product [Mytilus coruscus]|uniref:OTU domain-containing protein n=1 Tax=Mytilus coruscus TaxID=42192 RepID=A0A6J8CVT4_MYTCO|nr:unnamed protein product [Mytilus coruscus]